MSPKRKSENNQIEILVVEDSPTQAEQLKYILEKEGYHISVAHNGMEALSLLNKHKPGIVISDIVMPEMDGYQLCRQMKADENFKGIPVILLTALSDPKDVVKALECGADNFLTKPYEERYLLSRLKYFLINQEIRRTESIHMGLEIFFQGQKFLINSDRMQILNLLLSTYEAAVQKNKELTKVQDELRRLNEQLEERVEKRTADLKAEIIERKRIEEALRESEDRFRQFFENEPEYCYMVSLAGVIVDVNTTALKVLGYEKEELVGKPLGVIYAPESLSRIKELFARWKKTSNLRDEEIVIIARNGDRRTVLLSADAVKGKDGQMLYLVSVQRDITERKRAEEALRESEERFRALFEQAAVGVAQIDTETGRFLRINQRYCEIVGYTIQEMQNFTFQEITHPEDLRPDLDNVKLLTEGKTREFSMEKRYYHKNGSIVWVNLTVSPMQAVGGEPNSHTAIAVVQDITERKRAEQEMRTLEDQLRQSQKMEAIGSLAGGIAHDFNNLLTVIKGYTQLSLMELREEDPLKENLSEVGKAAEQAARLTRQILAFSRRQVMEMKVLELNTLIKDLDKMLQRVIGEDVELVTLLAGELGRVKTDSGQIEQVIMNLVVNAREAMPHGGKLTIETANVELDEHYARNHIAVEPGHYVMLAVSDTGVGMAPEVRDRVFEPFFTSKEKSKGTGLGLSMVYGIVKQSGGNIWVYSEPNQGTTFKIYLPRVDEPLEELKEEMVREETHRGGETILLVEDEAEVRKLAVRVLERQEYTVLEARDGEEALFICKERKEPIHLILTDVIMPQMGGPQLVEQLKQVRQDFKVLYMSGYTDNSITHQGVLEKGMNYIQKPFTVDGLARRVREVLDK